MSLLHDFVSAFMMHYLIDTSTYFKVIVGGASM